LLLLLLLLLPRCTRDQSADTIGPPTLDQVGQDMTMISATEE
jgi:hypothetical protein